MTKPIFSTATLQSEQTLGKFLYGKETIDAIKAQAKLPFASGESRLASWEVTWLAIASPLCSIYALFVKATGYLVFSFDAQNAQLLFAHAAYVEHNTLRWATYAIFGRDLLVSTLNTAAESGKEVYAHPSIPFSKVPQPAVRERFRYYQDAVGIRLQKNPAGQCFGESEFYAHLYFQTRKAFRNVEQHHTAISKVFSDGAPKEALLWQLAQYDSIRKPILGLRKTLESDITSPTAEKVRRAFERCKPGLYAVREIDYRGGEHRINLIKERNNQFYIFDPARGLINLSSQESYDRLLQELSSLSRINLFKLASS